MGFLLLLLLCRVTPSIWTKITEPRCNIILQRYENITSKMVQNLLLSEEGEKRMKLKHFMHKNICITNTKDSPVIQLHRRTTLWSKSVEISTSPVEWRITAAAAEEEVEDKVQFIWSVGVAIINSFHITQCVLGEPY